MIGGFGGLSALKATKPGRMPETGLKYQHQCDKQEVIDACLVCDEEKCPGDCEKRRTGSKRKSGGNRSGVKKNTDPATVVARYDAGMSINKISQELNLSPACVRYWLRKTGRKERC